jgi:hypothetical protein
VQSRYRIPPVLSETEMDAAPPCPPAPAEQLPPEAIALAGRLFEAARRGQMDMFEQALPRGLSPNMTNEKGDSLVGVLPFDPRLVPVSNSVLFGRLRQEENTILGAIGLFFISSALWAHLLSDLRSRKLLSPGPLWAVIACFL